MASITEHPEPIGIAPSMGFGDRIGVSTPGHIRALREAGLAGKVKPVFAQQSVRENARTGRVWPQVMADAQRAVRAAEWDLPWGADADHLKLGADLTDAAAAAFAFFTIDPSDYVNDAAASLPAEQLGAAYKDLFSGKDAEIGERLIADYARVHSLGPGLALSFSREDVQRAALVYWKAVQYTITLFQEALGLWKGGRSFDFEMSVDETSAPTTAAGHYLVAAELRRAGARLTSLAPRFVGSFEKGIDYIGDLSAFGTHLKTHAEIARALGPYKLSVHSGSDKFSIYPMLGRATGGLLHLKTAGTSYLEALRIPARHDKDLFRAIARRAIEHFAEARASYHLSTDIAQVPDPDRTSDGDLERRFLDAPDANAPRQVLHVAYGDVLNGPTFAPTFLQLLGKHPQEHAEDIARHMKRHLTAFTQ